ncbi:MAG: hypothetical protein ACYDBB_11635 [Armatimonadota bacterium]
MRSSTTFLIFGGIVAALILLAAFAKTSSANNPAIRTADAFIKAVAQHDAAAVQKLVDPAGCKVTKAGNRLGGLSFAEVTPGAGAFLKKPAVVWSSIELSRMVRESSVDPVFDNEHGLASVPMKGGFKFYLHRDGQGIWLIYYIAKPEEKK